MYLWRRHISNILFLFSAPWLSIMNMSQNVISTHTIYMFAFYLFIVSIILIVSIIRNFHFCNQNTLCRTWLLHLQNLNIIITKIDAIYSKMLQFSNIICRVAIKDKLWFLHGYFYSLINMLNQYCVS